MEDYTTIANDIMKYKDESAMTGPYIPTDSDLYQNFVALRAYLPMVDGIDLDQEEGNGQNMIDAMIAVGNMALDVGFEEVTLTPPIQFLPGLLPASGRGHQ